MSGLRYFIFSFINTKHVEFIVSVNGARKRPARTVLTGMCYSVGSATRQGSSSLTRFIGQSAFTSKANPVAFSMVV